MGPLDQLMSRQSNFVGEVATVMPDRTDVVWMGVARLAHAVVDGDVRVERGLPNALIVLGRKPGVPSYLDAWLDAVRRAR